MLLLDLLRDMSANNASDLFLVEGRPPARRVDGTVTPMDMQPTTADEIDALLEHILPATTLSRFRDSGDIDTGLSTGDGHRFRLNLARERGRTTLTARAVPSGELDFEALGLGVGPRVLADRQRGLVLVAGATGSGKSTTLAAMVHHINLHRPVHIVTIEDPIEHVHRDLQARVTQREIGVDTQSFSAALKHVVRQSPDVILIGELRDAETMQVALAAALTGHLVLASIHTIDATQTLQRILSYFPDHLRAQAAGDLAQCLQGILSQRLVPRADEPGRVLATELLTCTPPVAKLLAEGRTDEVYDLMRSRPSGELYTFNQSLLAHYRAGTISFETGLLCATNPDEFSLQARGMQTGVGSFSSGPAGADSTHDMKALLRMVLDRGASDLHLTVGRPPILRIDTALVAVGEDELTSADMRRLLYSILSTRQRTLYEIERELDFALGLESGRRFRVNAYFQRGHMAAALRAIPPSVPEAAELGLPQTVLDLGMKPHGLLLVVGPTGSGKSTTLACLVDRINRTRGCRILTIEDPIEYAHRSLVASIDQREVYSDTLSFAAGLKYILRQDPDVIMVGEMRDQETVASALTAAETGHLVMATLHSNDAIGAIDRIVDIFPPNQQTQIRGQLASSLLAVVSQRLLLRADGSGRVAVFEVMVGTTAVRAQVRENKMHQTLTTMEASRTDGMVTMDRALRQLYEAGTISFETASLYARDRRSIAQRPGMS